LNREASLRVAYVVQQYPAVSHRFILQEVVRLRELGVDVTTFSVRKCAEEGWLTALDREEKERTYTILPPRLLDLVRAHVAVMIRRPHRYSATLRLALRLRPPGMRGTLWQLFYLTEAVIVWHRCAALGVTHLHGQFASNATDVALLAVNLGGPEWRLSFTLHGSVEFYDVSRNRLGQKARFADLVVCISDFGKSQACAFIEEEHWPKVKVVHLGVDGKRLAPPGSRAHDGPALKVVTVGRLVPVKGHAKLIEAAAELRARGVPVEVTLVGGGPRREALERLAARLEVADSVTFTGALGHDEVLRHYADADLFCLPSFGEGLPVVLMEAMAMQLPVVASRIMGIPELVEHGEAGVLVTPGRSDFLADAIEELARDPELRRRMGQAGRRKVLEEFDLDASAQKLRDLFAELAGVSGLAEDEELRGRAAAPARGTPPLAAREAVESTPQRNSQRAAQQAAGRD